MAKTNLTVFSKKGLFSFKTLYNFTQPEAIQRSWGCEVRFRRGVCQSLLTCQIPSSCPLRRPWPSFCRAWNTACFPNLGGYAPWCRPRDVWYTLRDWPLFCQRRRLIRETACISWWDRFLWALSIFQKISGQDKLLSEMCMYLKGSKVEVSDGMSGNEVRGESQCWDANPRQ